MPSKPSEPTPTKAGILSTSSGERHIPSSVRPDGSKRKEIRIRPVYKPPEDVEVYRNRTAEAWKTRGSGGVPGAEPAAGGATSSGRDGEAKAKNKNAKRREAKRKAKAEGGDVDGGDAGGDQDEDEDEADDGKGQGGAGNEGEAGEEKVERVLLPHEAPPVDPEIRREKEVKRLQKKLRQARELRAKKESGESLLPEQFEKVIRIYELTRQLGALGVDDEGGAKKGDDGRVEGEDAGTLG